MGCETSDLVRFDLGSRLQGQIWENPRNNFFVRSIENPRDVPQKIHRP